MPQQPDPIAMMATASLLLATTTAREVARARRLLPQGTDDLATLDAIKLLEQIEGELLSYAKAIAP